MRRLSKSNMHLWTHALCLLQRNNGQTCFDVIQTPPVYLSVNVQVVICLLYVSRSMSIPLFAFVFVYISVSVQCVSICLFNSLVPVTVPFNFCPHVVCCPFLYLTLVLFSSDSISVFEACLCCSHNQSFDTKITNQP